jgi:creatinine amidohydrolase
MDQRVVQYERMHPREIREARAAASVVYVPLGPIEWHAEHLPVGTDPLHAHHVAVQAARRTGGVVMPATFMGTDSLRPPGDGPQGLAAFDLPGDARVIGMDFPGFPVKSMYFHETLLGAVVLEIVRMLKREWEAVVLVNGHGAPNQLRMLERIAAEETDLPSRVVVAASWWDAEARSGHADRHETSIVLGIDEDLVHLDRLPGEGEPLRYKDHGIIDGQAFEGAADDGFAVRRHADPRTATREHGEAVLEGEITRLAAVAAEALAAVAA